QTEDGFHQGGLARPVGADDADDLTGLHGQLHAVEDVNLGIPGPQAADFQQCHALCVSFCQEAAYAPPRYASSTSGWRRTSSGLPSTSLRPLFMTITQSHTSATRSMLCSTSRKVLPWSRRLRT